MRKLRILFVAAGFFKVGDYFRFKAFGESLAQLGHSITILTGDMRTRLTLGREVINGVEWLYPPYFGGVPTCEKVTDYLPETKLPYDIFYRIYFMLRAAGNYDLVHGFHVGFNTFLPLMAARAARTPALVFDWCDLWDNGIIRPPERGILKKIDYRLSVALEPRSVRFVDGVTVNNTYLANLCEQRGVARNRIRIIQDGAYSHEVKPIDREEARRRLRLDSSLFLLGFSGFFHPDTELLIEALALVRARTGEDIRLLFIGTTSESLLRFMAAQGVEQAVICVGAVEHEKIGEYLSACDLLVLPYTGRPVNLGRWPSKLGDYLSSARPVVAGGYGDVKDFFRTHPDIGLTYEGGAEAFAEAIIAMRNDPDRLRRGREAARRVAVEEMSWTKKTVHLEQFYYQLLEEKTGR